MTNQPPPERQEQPGPMVGGLRVEWVPVDTLTLDPRNAHRHPTRNLETIRLSLRRFGQQKPIVVARDGQVVAGNGTLEAARQEGWTRIAVVRTNLVGSELTAYGITDNRSGELAEWDVEQLADLLQQLADTPEGLAGLGWEDYELEPLLNAEWSPSPPGGDHGRGGWHDGERDAADKAVIALTEAEFTVVQQAAAAFAAASGEVELPLGAAVAGVCAAWTATAGHGR